MRSMVEGARILTDAPDGDAPPGMSKSVNPYKRLQSAVLSRLRGRGTAHSAVEGGAF